MIIRDNIKAIGGIGPGSTDTRKRLERRAYAKVRESNARRTAHPALLSYRESACAQLRKFYAEG